MEQGRAGRQGRGHGRVARRRCPVCVLRPRPEPHVPRSPQQGPDPDLGEAARHILLPTGLLAISIIGAQFNHGMMVCHREKLPREINIVETQEQRVKAEEVGGGGLAGPKGRARPPSSPVPEGHVPRGPTASQQVERKLEHFLIPDVLVAQLCLTLYDPIDCSIPGSSVHGILQARILEWVAMPFFRGSS